VDDPGVRAVEAVVSIRGVLSSRPFRRRDGRAALWLELAIAGWLFWLYDVINNLAPLRAALAVAHAASLFRVERALHFAPELAINHWLTGERLLSLVASYYYFFAHVVVTVLVLAWWWWRLPAEYVRMRTQLVVINLIAFAVFWLYPLAPPRALPRLGFVDVLAVSHAAVSWHSAALAHDANQYAAMPSLHVAWALWCAVAIARVVRRRPLAVLAFVYPVLTTVVVIATANHFLLDAAAGIVTVLVAGALIWAVARTLAFARDVRVTAGSESLDANRPG
jgi:hypothetical protein